MKKIITLILTLALILGCTTSTFAASSSGKYVKVKKATYQKYKKAYLNQKSYKEQIKKLKIENKNLKNAINSSKPETIVKTVVEKEEFDTSAYEKEIAELKEQVASLSNENAILKDKLGNMDPNDDIDELKHRLEQQEDINDWLWMSLSSLGISYANKVWSIPEEFPQTFIINGAKYQTQITREE